MVPLNEVKGRMEDKGVSSQYAVIVMTRKKTNKQTEKGKSDA